MTHADRLLEWWSGGGLYCTRVPVPGGALPAVSGYNADLNLANYKTCADQYNTTHASLTSPNLDVVVMY